MIRIVAERIGELWPFQGEVFMYKRRWVEMGIMKGEHNQTGVQLHTRVTGGETDGNVL